MSSPTSSPVRGSRLALTGVIVGVVGGLAVGRVALDVAAARRAGRAWRELDHRTTIPGEAPVLRLVVLGDSAAAGHGLSDASGALPWQLGTRLARRTGRAVEIAGHARSGADTAEVVAAQVAAAAGAGAVVIGVGVNDALAPRRRIGDVHADTARLLEAVRVRAPRARVVLLTCPDLGDAPGVPRTLRPVVRWRCRSVADAQTRAAERAGVPVVAVDGPLPAEVFGADGLHPSAAAVERLAELALPALIADAAT